MGYTSGGIKLLVEASKLEHDHLPTFFSRGAAPIMTQLWAKRVGLSTQVSSAKPASTRVMPTQGSYVRKIVVVVTVNVTAAVTIIGVTHSCIFALLFSSLLVFHHQCYGICF